jgi:hypothetical protein
VMRVPICTALEIAKLLEFVVHTKSYFPLNCILFDRVKMPSTTFSAVGNSDGELVINYGMKRLKLSRTSLSFEICTGLVRT